METLDRPSQLAATRRRLLRALGAIALLLVVLLAVEALVPRLGLGEVAPLRGAEWIWSAAGQRLERPLAFYAAADLVIESVPSTVLLVAAADEEYVLFINGLPLGLNRCVGSGELDSYDITSYLRPGANRIVAELRSGRGAGGFLLSILLPEGRQILGTGAAWRIFDRYEEALFSSDLAVDLGEAPHSWGPPPVGRWRAALPAGLRPTLAELYPRGFPFEQPQEAEELAPDRWLYGWRTTVCGYPRLEFAGSPEGPGLVETRQQPGAPQVTRAHEVVVLVAGLESWQAPVPRCFRYLLFVGPEEPRTVAALLLSEEKVRELAPQRDEERGVFGIAPPALRTPAQDEVRRRLESLPRLAGGEEG